MYTRILNDIAKGPHWQITLECFRWILRARRTFSPEELTFAIALADSPALPEDMDSRMMATQSIPEICGNLLLILSYGHGPFAHQRVVPTHFSVIEYLRNLPLHELDETFWSTLADGQALESVLASRCIEGLILGLPKDEHHFRENRFTDYAASHFDTHALSAVEGSQDVPTELVAGIDRLLHQDERTLTSLLMFRSFASGMKMYKFDASSPAAYVLWTTRLRRISGLPGLWKDLSIPKYALHHAAAFGNVADLQALIHQGHDINEVDDQRQSPLNYACYAGVDSHVELLLRNGSFPGAIPGMQSPLEAAVYGERASANIAKILLSRKADIVTKACKNLLHRAVSQDALEMTKILLLNGADVNYAHTGETPLMYARSLAMAGLLCDEFSADFNTRRNGRTILHHFAESGRGGEVVHVIQFFLSKGFNTNERSDTGLSVLDYAALNTANQEPLKFLLQHFPDLIKKTALEWTPLHWACSQGAFRNAELLLDFGLRTTKITIDHSPRGWSPYDIAIYKRQSPSSVSLGASIQQALGKSEDSLQPFAQEPEVGIRLTSVWCESCSSFFSVRSARPNWPQS